MDNFQEDIIELRNFKSKHGLKEMVVHIHESNIDNTLSWIYIAHYMEKLIIGSKLSYTICENDFETGLYPLITTNSLYLIELENDGSDCLKQIEYYKKRVTEIKNKLAFKNFSGKAPVEIVELEKKRLSDFEKRWERASIGYMFI